MGKIEKFGGFFMPLRRFNSDRKAATAIEFSILAIPFIMIVFAVIETSVSFTAQQVMSNSVDQLARKIRTGQINASTTNKDQFRTLICDDLKILVADSCPDLEFDLQSYSKFADVPTTIPMSSPTALDTSKFKYAPSGTGGDINHLRVFYKWPVITDIMKSHLAGLDNGRTLLYSSATWKNEPF